MRANEILVRLWALGAVTALSGCSVVTSLDGYEVDEGCDLDLTVRNFTPHVTTRQEIRVVSAGGELEARAILNPLGSANVRIMMPMAVPSGDQRLEFFADADGDGIDDGVSEEHSWMLTDVCASSPIVFQHTTDFQELSPPTTTGDDYRMSATNMPTGGALEVQVREVGPDAEPGRTVGLYRMGEVTEESFEITIPGILDRESMYAISFWIDEDRDGTYSQADQAGRITVSGEMARQLDFEPTGDPGDIERLFVILNPPTP